MAKVYSRVTKINNVVGRSDYISNPDRQEFIKLTGKSSDFEWKEYADFEKANQKSQEKNNEARELVIALPNEMSENFSHDILENFSHDLAKKLLGENRDYEFALHFNHSQTNFHVHLLFSERERQTERTPKVYKRDMWFDQTTNRMAKAHAEHAECRHKKGDVMTDKEGNIRYDDTPFTKKDPTFTERSWIKSHQKTIQNVLAEYHYVVNVFDSKHEIAQKKLYKGASAEYVEYAQHWNQIAHQANQALNKERSTLVEEYKILKPLMNEYKLFVGKEKEMEQADLNLKIYKHNGYSGTHWNVFKRTKYFLMNYEEDRINVKLYKEVRNKVFRSVFSQDDFDTPTNYFKQLVQKIKRFPERVKQVTNTMMNRYGTVERYKEYQQEVARKERAKERKEASKRETQDVRHPTFSMEGVKKERMKNQEKKPQPKRNRGFSR